jgi:hypothetical protein
MDATTRTGNKTEAKADEAAAAAAADDGVKDPLAKDSAAKDSLVKDSAVKDSAGKDASEAPAAGAADEELSAEESAELEAELDAEEARAAASSAGVGSGAGAIVAAGLGLVALTGGWTGRVLAERETLVGQLTMSKASAPAAQIEGLYGNGWHTTALVNGGFALLAVLVGVGVLVALSAGASSTATGSAVAARPVWIRAVAWGGVILGIIGLLISAGMYFDLFAAMPTPPSA